MNKRLKLREAGGHTRSDLSGNVVPRTFKYDLGSEDREGGQDSTISVFTRDGDGTLRHFYSGHPRLAPEIKERGVDELTPIFNMLDLTPQGRGSW